MFDNFYLYSGTIYLNMLFRRSTICRFLQKSNIANATYKRIELLWYNYVSTPGKQSSCDCLIQSLEKIVLLVRNKEVIFLIVLFSNFGV